ncbi:MAG TPA: type III pantothenate kinase, partial [Oleiagrimonas sp.]|nr:type III pantothenate kinase [Oleiagrimonas sp.]
MDLGNTRIKWVMADADAGMGPTQALAWQGDVATAMARVLADAAPPQGVWAASVVDAEREAAVEAAM